MSLVSPVSGAQGYRVSVISNLVCRPGYHRSLTRIVFSKPIRPLALQVLGPVPSDRGSRSNPEGGLSSRRWDLNIAISGAQKAHLLVTRQKLSAFWRYKSYGAGWRYGHEKEPGLSLIPGSYNPFGGQKQVARRFQTPGSFVVKRT